MNKVKQDQLKEIILKRRKKLLEQKEKEGKTFAEMIDVIDEEINQLENENVMISFKQKTAYIGQLDAKIAEKVDERREYTQTVLDYLGKENQNNKRIDYLIISIITLGLMGYCLINELSLLPIILCSVAATVGIEQIKNIVEHTKEKKAFKLNYFNNGSITKKEIEESLIKKNIQIIDDLEKLDDQKNVLNAQLNNEKESLHLIWNKQCNLMIDKEILRQENISSDVSKNTENLIEKVQFYADQLFARGDVTIENVENCKTEEQPKMQVKRFKLNEKI